MSILDLLFPTRCAFCGKIISDKSGVCQNCLDKLPVIVGSRCRRCGCAKSRCSCTPIVNHYDRIVAPFYYEDAAKDMISQIKNHNDGKSADVAAAFMSEECRRSLKTEFDVVTCVPTDVRSFVKRGYNPAEMLAVRFAENMCLPFKRLLKKKNVLRSQKTSDRLHRLENICGAYKINADVSGKNILLVDDVKTTGATINECCRILKENGAARVYAVVLCITAKN